MPDSLRFLPYGRQVITEADIAEVVKVLKSDFLTQGPEIERFEDSLKRFIGCKHVVVVNNATAGLHLAYMSLGVGEGDAVIAPSITFAATANAAVYCGATPIFADVDQDSGLMTGKSLLDAIELAKKKGLNPKLVVPVHYGGLPVNMEEIVKIAIENNLAVFEDACHALGGKYRRENGSWQNVGNWQDGSKGASFSFHPVKHIATGEGGAIATNDDELADKIRLYRTHGITKDPSKFKQADMAFELGQNTANPWYYEMQQLGWNYRMNDISAALGNSQMQRFSESLKKRIEIAAWYNDILKDLPISLPRAATAFAQNAWHLYPVLINFKKMGTSRKDLFSTLKGLGIGLQVHYIPVPSLPYYREKGHQTPIGSQQFYEREISLPMYTDLNRADVERVCQSLKNALKI